MAAWLKRIDDGLYALERWIAVVASVVMAIVVFFDVVHRRYSSVDSKLVEKLGSWTGMDPEGSTYLALQDASTWIVWGLSFLLVYFGLRSASSRPLIAKVPKPKPEDDPPMSKAKAAGVAVVSLVVTWLVLRILFGTGVPEDILECGEDYSWTCGIYPNGMTWAQPLALIFTLWLGFVGASMATHDHRHLKVEALQRYLPEKAQRAAGLLSALASAAFCIFLAMLAYRYVGYKHEDFVDAGGLGGFHDGIDIPRYQTFVIVPFAYAVMALRFISTGILAARGELDTTPSELADIDFGDDEPAGEPESESKPESKAESKAESKDESPPPDDPPEDEATGDDDAKDDAKEEGR